MNNIIIHICDCPIIPTNDLSQINASDILTAGISIVTLLLNILFYIIIAPRINFRFQKKEDFLKYSSDFIVYLSKVNSFKSFKGVPTKVKSYCVSIHLLFKSGKAPEPLNSLMEQVFQSVKKRKKLTTPKDINDWEVEFRKLTHELRKELAHYTGIFK